MIPSNLSLSDKLYSIDDLLEKAQTESERHQDKKKKLYTKTAINHLIEIKNNQAELSELKSNYKQFSAVLKHIGSQIEVLSPKDFKRYQDLLTKLIETNSLEGLTEGESDDDEDWFDVAEELFAIGNEALANVSPAVKTRFEELSSLNDIKHQLLSMKLFDREPEDLVKPTTLKSMHTELLRITDALLNESAKQLARSDQLTLAENEQDLTETGDEDSEDQYSTRIVEEPPPKPFFI